MNFIILQPLRICILGPPASGKTTVCQKLCEFYKLHHIKIKDVIDEALEELVRPNLVQNGWKNDTLGQLYRTVDFCVRHYFLLCKPYICKRKMSESLVQLKNKIRSNLTIQSSSKRCPGEQTRRTRRMMTARHRMLRSSSTR